MWEAPGRMLKAGVGALALGALMVFAALLPARDPIDCWGHHPRVEATRAYQDSLRVKPLQLKRGCSSIRPRIGVGVGVGVGVGNYRLETGNKPSSTGCVTPDGY